MRAWIGKSLVAIGTIHSIYGFVFFRKIIGQFAGERFFNALGSQFDKHAVFWFLMTGFTLMIVGGLADSIEKKGGELPSFLRWTILALTIIGCFMIPASGFWLLFAPVIGMYIRSAGPAVKGRTQAF